jgi:hypothetical protein
MNSSLAPWLTPELIDLKQRIVDLMVRDSEGCLDPAELESIQITVRIACEFFLFLQQSDDVLFSQQNNIPGLDWASYMAGTVRSGMDWFFSVAQTGRILSGLELQTGFGRPQLPTTFAELRVSYASVFQQMLESTHSIKALGLLLSLVKMMLLFVTVYFESFLSFSPESGS